MTKKTGTKKKMVSVTTDIKPAAVPATGHTTSASSPPGLTSNLAPSSTTPALLDNNKRTGESHARPQAAFVRLPAASVSPSGPQVASKKGTALDSVDRTVSSIVSTFLSSTSYVLRLVFILAIKPFLLLLSWGGPLLVGVAIAAGAVLLGWRAVGSSLATITSLSSLLPFPPLSVVTPLTCFLGVYCPRESSVEQSLHVGKLAHSLRVEATRANDIFESVIGMSDLRSVSGGLHQTEIWELAMSVRRGSKLEGREILSSELVELGDLTRDMKDRLVGINSQGINSFTFIVHSFTVLENSLRRLSPPPSSPTDFAPATILSKKDRLALQRQLTQLISHLSTTLTSLQESVESTIPLASRASNLGGRLQEEFLVEQLARQDTLESEPLWAPLIAGAQKAIGKLGEAREGDFRRDVVKKDMKLAAQTVSRLRDIRQGMEDVREDLVRYRDNVGYFRAGVVGWFAGGAEEDDEIDVEGEMAGLRDIMGRFDGSLKAAKSQGRRGGGDSRILGGERLNG